MSFKYQRKTLRFATGKSFEFTAVRTPTTYLAAALSDQRTALSGMENIGETKTAVTDAFTAAAWNASAVIEIGKMYQVLTRTARCLTDNGLAESV